MAVIFYSLRIDENKGRYSLIVAGILSGLATAVRYSTAISVLVPSFILLSRYAARRSQSCSDGSTLALARSFALLAGSMVMGFFLGDPPWFLRFETIRPRLEYTASFAATDEFAWSSLLDLSRIWEYLSYLIPHGAAPFLWIVFYGSFIYVVFCRHYYRFTWPLIGTAVVYL